MAREGVASRAVDGRCGGRRCARVCGQLGWGGDDACVLGPQEEKNFLGGRLFRLVLGVGSSHWKGRSE